MQETALQKELKRRIEASGLTARAISTQAGLNPSAISQIFSGKLKSPTYATLSKIASVLDCAVDELAGNTPSSTPTLSLLGQKAKLPQSPEEAVLEKVKNPHADAEYLIRFTCPEFTSLCPVTGQPDFAHLVIDYVPNKWIVESKSLKLFMGSFRNHAAFHEDCTVGIAKRIVKEIKPTWLRIGGYWYPRGGIPIDVFYETGKKPTGLWIPDQNVQPYRGRG